MRNPLSEATVKQSVGRKKTPSLRAVMVLVALAMSAGCDAAPRPEVVVYAALDAEFSRPILTDFTAQTGIETRAKFDVESTKTVGLTQLLIQEGDRPRCDVFWNNEILNTLRLEERGLLEAYRPERADEFPGWCRSPEGTWHGFAARARVLVVNTDLVPEADRPTSILDLADERWRGRTGIAKPLFGTTATHAACLFAVWGEDEAEDFFRRLKQNEVQVMSGNKQVAEAVGAGRLTFGLTDTDDAMIEIESGRPVAIVYPDQAEDGLGTLFIPNTLAIMKGCPHPAEARRLLDYLLGPEVESRLAAGSSAQIPLHPEAQAARVKTPTEVRAMQVDFSEAVQHWDRAAAFLREEFTVE
jgi:iron(III) transport system substrate-binding protein